MDFQRARITEVNQNLKIVMESSDRVRFFIQNMSLVVRKPVFGVSDHV